MHDAYLACHAICINPGYRGQLRAEKPSWALTCAHSCRRRGRALKRKRHNLFAFRTHGLREYSVLADGHRGARIGPRVDIAWLCAPRWYGDAVSATLTGGDSSFCVTPTGRFAWGRHYEERSLIWGNAGRRRFPRPDSTSDTAAKPSASCRPDRSRRSRGAPRGRALLPSVHRASRTRPLR